MYLNVLPLIVTCTIESYAYLHFRNLLSWLLKMNINPVDPYETMKMKTLILGMGNDILTDDAIGPLLINDLSGIIGNRDVDFNIAFCGGLEIIEYISGYEKVIFIDGIHTNGGIPGDVYYYKPSDFQETSHLSSLHDITFLTSLKLGHTLGIQLPTDLHIIAIEIVEDMEFSMELTLPLKKRYPEILKEVIAKINAILD